ncbi:hypothetical protein CENSYa_1119 [Cenarchaeum symbiosum A]|uniref:Uncharacterized protein n=1 Tax=Cenarchaeum symbiosum (strain A) TaxID=414004 RepID=A0RWN1_CENSY|nr:hypothetical protein CENSYa_1119 [Cenarchaeum symbiosum A]
MALSPGTDQRSGPPETPFLQKASRSGRGMQAGRKVPEFEPERMEKHIGADQKRVVVIRMGLSGSQRMDEPHSHT